MEPNDTYVRYVGVRLLHLASGLNYPSVRSWR
jgi:hypothetical protein